MQKSRIVMGMPARVEVIDPEATAAALESVFAYFDSVDERFSTYRETSEISQINAGRVTERQWSPDMREVLAACEATKAETGGFFDPARAGFLDPSGYVKGWAIQNAASLLEKTGFKNYYLEIGGDIQVAGQSGTGKPWVIGIRNPFQREEIVKRLSLSNSGVATSGTAIRGQHIYDPHDPARKLTEVASLTVIGPAILDADRYATAAFAMGTEGIRFIAELEGFEAYQIDRQGMATFTPGFPTYVLP